MWDVVGANIYYASKTLLYFKPFLKKEVSKTDYDTYYFYIFNLDFHCAVSMLHQQQKLYAISSLTYNSTSQCLPSVTLYR